MVGKQPRVRKRGCAVRCKQGARRQKGAVSMLLPPETGGKHSSLRRTLYKGAVSSLPHSCACERKDSGG
jgi:hypothetical protein